MHKQVDGYSALPLLFLMLGLMGALFFIREATKPTPTKPPLYKAGECLRNTPDPDSGSTRPADKVMIKVIAVGKKNYQLLLGEYDGKKLLVKLTNQSIETLDPGTEKIDCPKEMNDPRALEKASE